MSTAVLDFVITEHPPAITPGLERDYEIIRRRIERLAGVPVRSRHYCDAGDFAAAMIPQRIVRPLGAVRSRLTRSLG